MATYCRITGKSRGLPKPNYFPLLPPISPADAKRLCKITGKSYGLDSHHYIPVLFAKMKKKKAKSGARHSFLKGFNYYSPSWAESEGLKPILQGKQCTKNTSYTYVVKEKNCVLVLPENVEQAVKTGEISDVMLSTETEIILVRLKDGHNICVDLKKINKDDLTGEVFEGEGEKTAKVKKAKPMDSIAKIFEDKEKAAEVEPVKPTPKKRKAEVRDWKNVEVVNGLNFATDIEFGLWEQCTEEKTCSKLPGPVKIEPKSVSLSESIPGLVQQPHHSKNLATLSVANVIAPFKAISMKTDSVLLQSIKEMSPEDHCKTIGANEILHENKVLLEIEEIPSLLTALGGAEEVVEEIGGRKINGLKVNGTSGPKFIVGQSLKTEEGVVFVAGQSLPTSNGNYAFTPGISVSSPDGPKFLPGQTMNFNNEPMFVVGQIVLTRDGEKFVQGQTMETNYGTKFTPGQTILTEDGMRFVAGQTLEERFIPGQIVQTEEGVEFVCGQVISTDSGNMFVPGQSVWSEKGWEFVPGKTMEVNGEKKFVPGMVLGNDNNGSFVPGQYVKDGNDNIFVPGVTVDKDGLQFVCGSCVDTPEGQKFVEGKVIKNDEKLKFIPNGVATEGKFEFAPSSTINFDFSNCSVPKRAQASSATQGVDVYSDGVFGHMVHSNHGVEFFPGTPGALPAGKVVPGRLIRGKEVKFVPGIMAEDRFVPGQVVKTSTGDEFVPGQVIETTEGPKFVPGQIISTKAGPKFVPGQTVDSEEGSKFIPGQIVETNSGPTFIPGQVIYTEEEGSKFVPGEVVETKEGPRFVPGRVIEDGERVVFIPGQVVETEDGLKFVAPDLTDEEGEKEFTVQGFQVPPEELCLIQPSLSNACAADVKEMTIDSKMLRQLSDAGMAIGRQVPAEIPVVDIHTAPAAMTVACNLSKKLSLDPVSTAKVSQVLMAISQLGKLGEIQGESDEEIVINNLLERVVHCKTEEETYKMICSIMERELGDNTPLIVDKLHTFLTSKDSPLKKLNKVNILKEIINENVSHENLVDKLSTVLNEEDQTVSKALKKFSECNPEIVDMIVERILETMGEVESEKEAMETLHRAVVATVREASEMSIVDLLKDAENLGLKELLLGAVNLAKALDMMDVASGLLDIVSNPKCTDILAGDRVTLEILRRLTVMKQLAQKRPDLISALTNLQRDPYSARSDPMLKELVRESGALLVIPEEGVTSESVPSSLLFSQNSLAMEEFLTRTKRTYPILVIIKSGIQAIIPRNASHSVLAGTVPYAVLDEKGLHYFQPKNVLSALRLPKIAMNWFSMYKCEIRETNGGEVDEK